MYKPRAVYGVSFSSVTFLRHLSFSFVFVRFPQRDYVMMKGIFLISIFFCSYFSSLEIRIWRILDNFLSSSFLRSLNSLVHSSRKLTLRLLDFISKHQVTFTILPWEYVTIFLLGNLPFHFADEGRAIRAKYSILYFRGSHHLHSVFPHSFHGWRWTQ